MSSNPVSAITDPISSVLGTSGGGGGLLGAVEDVGGFLGDAGKVIDDAVIQPAIDDPVNTAIKLGATYVGGPIGGSIASAAIAAGQGKDLEDIAKGAATSYVAGQVGGEFGGFVGEETGSQLAGSLAQGGASGATSATLSGRDPVQGLLRGVTGAAIGQGVNTAVDFGSSLFSPSGIFSNLQVESLVKNAVDAGVGGAEIGAMLIAKGISPEQAVEATGLNSDIILQAYQGGASLGSTGMNDTFFENTGIFTGTGEDFDMGVLGATPDFGPTYEELTSSGPYLNELQGDGGGFTGTGEDFNMGGNPNIIPGELGDIVLDPQGNVVLSSGADIQAAQSLGFDSRTITDYAKQFGTQALKTLLGTRIGGAGGAVRPTGGTQLTPAQIQGLKNQGYSDAQIAAMQSGLGGLGTGAGGLGGGLLGAGANYLLSDAARRAIQTASQQSAAQQLAATQRAEQASTFKPVGVTTAFGQSQFQFDPTTGQLTSAGYTATPQVAAQRERLFGLGAAALPTTADTQAIQQQYIAQQQGLLAPSREQQLAQLRNRQFQRGTTGLATGGTVAGYTPGAAGLMQTNPEMAAYYNALAQQEAALAANAPTYAQNLLNQRIATGTGLFGQAGALETMAQQPLTLGAGLGAQAATAGSRAGLYGLTGAQGAAQTQLYGNVAGASGQLGQAQGLLTGVSPYLQQAGEYVLKNWLA
jgi:hypothetical protein